MLEGSYPIPTRCVRPGEPSTTNFRKGTTPFEHSSSRIPSRGFPVREAERGAMKSTRVGSPGLPPGTRVYARYRVYLRMPTTGADTLVVPSTQEKTSLFPPFCSRPHRAEKGGEDASECIYTSSRFCTCRHFRFGRSIPFRLTPAPHPVVSRRDTVVYARGPSRACGSVW